MVAMAQNFISQLPVFTLESLIALEQWSTAQSQNRRKSAPKRQMRPMPDTLAPARREKPEKNEAA
jgi:hypothetical protein